MKVDLPSGIEQMTISAFKFEIFEFFFERKTIVLKTALTNKGVHLLRIGANNPTNLKYHILRLVWRRLKTYDFVDS